MDESALWEKIPQGKLTVPLWYTTRVFPLWETQRDDRFPVKSINYCSWYKSTKRLFVEDVPMPKRL